MVTRKSAPAEASNDGPVLHVVHAIDTEGPLDEDLDATFHRIGELFGVWLPPSRETLGKLQKGAIPLDGIEGSVARAVAPALLNYNRTWADIRSMLDEALSKQFRRELVDDFGEGWVYSWHCVDHMGFGENPRHKDLGYGNVFRFYRRTLNETCSDRDELNWHFHPLSITRNPLAAATSYLNSMDLLLQIWCRRIIDDNWFPTTNRPGFHAERADAHLFLEQWLPFDYANQATDEDDTAQRDTQLGRFGDWRRAPRSWLGYHPSHDDYQRAGECRRWIFRCLNVGTRLRLLQEAHLLEAFREASSQGSAIVAFADHDYRDIRADVRYVRDLLAKVRPAFPGVRVKFSGAHEAACAHAAVMEPETNRSPPDFSIELNNNRLHVRMLRGRLMGSQPFLAIKTKSGAYHHDNFDILTPDSHWTYVFDGQTIPIEAIDAIGVGAAGRAGHSVVKRFALHRKT